MTEVALELYDTEYFKSISYHSNTAYVLYNSNRIDTFCMLNDTILRGSFIIASKEPLESFSATSIGRVFSYEDSIVIATRTLKKPLGAEALKKYYSNFDIHVEKGVLYYPQVDYKCLGDAFNCDTFVPEAQVDLSSGVWSTVPMRITLTEPYLNSNTYCSRVCVGYDHYYSIANSSFIYKYNTVSGLTVSKDVRSKHQQQDFRSCAGTDTSDEVAYVINALICAPQYEAIVYNPKHRVLLRVFKKEQELFREDGKTNGLWSRECYLQVIDTNLNLIREARIMGEARIIYCHTFDDSFVCFEIYTYDTNKKIRIYHYNMLELIGD